MDILNNVLLKPYTSFRIGGEAKKLIVVYSDKELQQAIVDNKKAICVGSLTNVLVSSNGYSGTLVKLGSREVVYKDKTVSASGGAYLSAVSRFCAKQSLSGLEWAVSVPGTIGGALVGNAGAHGGDMARVVKNATILRNGNLIRLKNSELGFGYRKTNLRKGDIVTAVEFNLNLADSDIVLSCMQDNIKKRKLSQPTGYSAGSVFLSDNKHSAGWYIEKCGLKNFSVGGAYVSQKHANFIINDGFATSNNVKNLIDIIKNKVYNTFNITLTKELKYLGE